MNDECGMMIWDERFYLDSNLQISIHWSTCLTEVRFNYSCILLFLYSIIHLFYYSCILLFMYSIILVFYYSCILLFLYSPSQPFERLRASPQPQPQPQPQP